MAAQEYYQGQAQGPAPRPAETPNPPSLQVTSANPPYPLYDGPPPPYSPGEQRPHSQPPPQRRPQHPEYPPEKSTQQQPPIQPQPSPRLPPYSGPSSQARTSSGDYDSQFRPPVRQQHSYAYPNEKNGQPPSGPPQTGHPQSGYPQQYQQPYHGAQPVQPPYTNGHYPNASGNNVAFAGNNQYLYPARSRSRSSSRRRGEKRHHQRKKSSGMNTFLGGAGGAFIGDMIFPGLGTLGGAILGGLGGHEYGKTKGKSHETRHHERRYSDDYDHRPSRR